MTVPIATLIVQCRLEKYPQITHAKVIVESDESLRVTFGKLNLTGHYHPDRKVRQTITPTPGTARLVYDGAGWNLDMVKSFIYVADLATWGDTENEQSV